MEVKLINYTPLSVASDAIRTCWDSFGENGKYEIPTDYIEEKDIELMARVLKKYRHESAWEHLLYCFDISGISRACYDDKTEILTDEGWKYFKDIKDDEIVATMNIETELVEFHKIKENIKYSYSGDLHHYKNTNVDIMVTPNHRMLYKKIDIRIPEKKWTLNSSNNININKIKFNKYFKYSRYVDDFINIQGYEYTRKNNCGRDFIKKIPDKAFDKDVFFPFLAWYLSDGSTYYDSKENKYVINISQKINEPNVKNRTVERIMDLISKMGYNARYDGNAIKFNSLLLGKFLKELGVSNKKYIPFNLFKEFNKHYSDIFIKEYFKGDGYIKPEGCGTLFTTSKILADQLNILTFMAGYTSKIREIDRRGEAIINGIKTNCNHICYYVEVTLSGKVNITPTINIKKHRTVKKYNGMVYCVNVKNNTIFVRSKGKAFWCGNCLQEWSRHRIQSLSVKSSRYCLKELKTASINDVSKYCVLTGEPDVDRIITVAFTNLIQMVKSEYKNDIVKYCMPEAMKTEFRTTINARSLNNLLNLRSDKSALWEFRLLSNRIFDAIPESHKFLFDIAVCK